MICLNQRLYRLSRAREPPFFAATMSDEATCNAVDMYVLSASCEEKKVLRCGQQAQGRGMLLRN